MFGYHSYANVQLPKNITREQLYKTMLYEQEKEFKKEILDCLECSNEEFEYYENIMHNIYKEHEKKIISNNDHFYNIENIYPDLLDCLQKVFPDRDYYQVKIISSKNSHKFGGFMGKSLEDKYIVGISFYDTATLYIDKILYKTKIKEHYAANYFEILCHELSHIYHKDRIFMAIIDILLTNREFMSEILFNKTNFIDLKDLSIEKIKSYDVKIIKKSNLEKAHVLYDEWLKFIEIRSDLESLFVMKETDKFKQLFETNFYGYPYYYNFLTLYENHFPVPYRQDFLKGIIYDIETQIEKKISIDSCL
jgi:hypothetical protein